MVQREAHFWPPSRPVNLAVEDVRPRYSTVFDGQRARRCRPLPHRVPRLHSHGVRAVGRGIGAVIHPCIIVELVPAGLVEWGEFFLPLYVMAHPVRPFQVDGQLLHLFFEVHVDRGPVADAISVGGEDWRVYAKAAQFWQCGVGLGDGERVGDRLSDAVCVGRLHHPGVDAILQNALFHRKALELLAGQHVAFHHASKVDLVGFLDGGAVMDVVAEVVVVPLPVLKVD